MAKKSNKTPTPAKKRRKSPQAPAAVAEATAPNGPETATVEGGEAQGATAEAAGAPAASVEGASGKAAAGAVAQVPKAQVRGPAAEGAPDPTPACVPALSGATADQSGASAARPKGRGKGRAAKTGPADAAVQPGKRSALDAAAQVLAEAGAAMTCQEMIGAMAAKGYWTSPGGKTPAATLYSAILTETRRKGPQSRFIKTERGQFGLAGRG